MSSRTGKREAEFQSQFIEDLRDKGCICLKQEPAIGKQKGVPDYLVIYRSRWMFLEFKASLGSSYRPGQKEWLERLSKWGYAKRVCPETARMIKSEIERIIADEDSKIDRQRDSFDFLGA